MVTTVSGRTYLRSITSGNISLPDTQMPDTFLPDDVPLALRGVAYIRGSG